MVVDDGEVEWGREKDEKEEEDEKVDCTEKNTIGLLGVVSCLYRRV